MADRVVEYLINLRGQVQGIAQMVKSAMEASKAVTGLGQATVNAEKAMANLGRQPNGLVKVAKDAASAQKAIWGVGDAAGKTAKQLRDMHWTQQQQAAMAQRVLNSYGSRVGGGGSGVVVPPGGGKSERYLKGLHTGMGLHTLATMGHNDVLKENLEFEEQVRLTRGILYRAKDSQINNLRREALEMSRGSIFTSKDVMEGFKDLAGRGVPIEDMPIMLKQVMGLATGSGEPLTKTMDAHLAILRQFNMPIKDIPHISDVLAAVQMKTGAKLSEQESFFRYAGPSASTFGVNFKDLAAMEGALALKGISGSLAGTGLRRLMTRNLSWTKQNAEIWDQLGISKTDLLTNDGKLKDMIGLIERLRKATEPGSSLMHKGDSRGEIFMRLFGDRAGPIMSALADSLDTVRKLRGELDDVEGLAEKMSEKGLQGLPAAVKIVESAYNRMKLAIGQSGFNDQIEALARFTAGVLDAMSALDGNGNAVHPWLLQVAGWAAMAGSALSAMAMPLLALSILGPSIAKAFAFVARLTGLTAVASALARILFSARALMLLTGIGAALFIGYEVVNNWQSLAAAVKQVGDALKGIVAHGDFTKAAQGIKDVVGDKAFEKGRDAGLNARYQMAKMREWFASWIGMGTKSGMAGVAQFAPQFMTAQAMAARNRDLLHRSHAVQDGARYAPPATSGQAQRVQVESSVRLDPIQIQAPPSIDVRVTGTINGNVQGSGKVPLSATAPRGQATSNPIAPPAR